MLLDKNKLNTAMSRGKRVRSVRMLAGLTREQLSQKHLIAAPTLRAWETPRENGGGLTSNGAERFVKALNKEGVFCTVNWLLDGTGPGPRLLSEIVQLKPKNRSMRKIDWNEEESILKELQTFKELNPDSVSMLIMDDGMEPFYKKGSYVSGKVKMGPDIEKFIGKPCIIQTVDNLVLLRLFQKGKLPNTYTLYCSNPMPTAVAPIMYDVMIKNIAEVLWLRNKEN